MRSTIIPDEIPDEGNGGVTQRHRYLKSMPTNPSETPANGGLFGLHIPYMPGVAVLLVFLANCFLLYLPVMANVASPFCVRHCMSVDTGDQILRGLGHAGFLGGLAAGGWAVRIIWRAEIYRLTQVILAAGVVLGVVLNTALFIFVGLTN